MRIRLQLLLPLAVGLLVGIGFLVVGSIVDDAVRDALLTVPGLTRERAAEVALRQVLLAGMFVTFAATLVSAVLARMVAMPLQRVRETAQRLTETDGHHPPGTPVAEIQDVAQGITRVADELRSRHAREVRERMELAALVEAVSDGILQLDGEGRVVRSNRAARELLGLPEDPVGRAATSLIRSAEVRRMLDQWREGEGAGADPAEIVLDGRRVLVSITAQRGGDMVVTAVDLTDLRRLEEIRRDFVANASHELKTPLTSIRGYTETLLDADLPPADQRQFLTTIARNAGRLQRIVDDLLDLSRLESGGWQPELERIDVLEAAQRFWVPFADRAAEQGVAFSAAGEGETVGIADARALEQVFGNLYDNALRYTQGGGRVQVRVNGSAGAPGGVGGGRRPTDDQRPAAWLVAEVRDTGGGIPRDSLPRIFERFYRVDPARSRAEGGTGLGLSIVKHMMESINGAVTAESELGKGTTIRLWVPSAGSGAAVAQS